MKSEETLGAKEEAEAGEARRRREGIGLGVRDGLGVPGIVLGASFLGFGSLVRESGLSLPFGLISTATGWALPGQLALVELYGAGAGLLAVTLAVALTNARLLPMTISAMPLLRHPDHPRPLYWIAAHFIAVTGWAQLMRRVPELRPEHRLPYFLALTVTLWVISLLATAIGWELAGQVPQPVTLGLVFLNPLYFLLLFLAEVASRPRLLALLFGAGLGPLFHLLTPDWGLLLSGLIAGSLAFALDRVLARRSHA
jgi:predicted branched-subunit amino acid permease